MVRSQRHWQQRVIRNLDNVRFMYKSRWITTILYFKPREHPVQNQNKDKNKTLHCSAIQWSVSICVCVSCSMTTQQPYTKDESLHLMSPTNSSFLFFIFCHFSLPPSLHPCPSRPLSQPRADYRQRRASAAAAVQKLRRFNFLLFIVATQTTFKLLPFRPVPLPSRPNLRLSPPQNLHCPTVPGWPPLPEIWLELQSWLDGVRGIKNQAITVKKLKSCVLYGSGVPRGGGD